MGIVYIKVDGTTYDPFWTLQKLELPRWFAIGEWHKFTCQNSLKLNYGKSFVQIYFVTIKLVWAQNVAIINQAPCPNL